MSSKCLSSLNSRLLFCLTLPYILVTISTTLVAVSFAPLRTLSNSSRIPFSNTPDFTPANIIGEGRRKYVLAFLIAVSMLVDDLVWRLLLPLLYLSLVIAHECTLYVGFQPPTLESRMSLYPIHPMAQGQSSRNTHEDVLVRCTNVIPESREHNASPTSCVNCRNISRSSSSPNPSNFHDSAA